ncbi:Spy/CpxP family protein refolding chaperone [Undibacter mobilis]|uniref:LTXXQ motif family protein n=1 Tax=Undibacter mobilis TaxID=2292256 RepID=A0A371BEG7_9BRAD|nr:Spy/CpxP family protein refolding chaperone [Undibacter mobilis]RDV05751.1 hypothetical protein DXH78_07090 [Undibacter mobilis]
MRAGIAISTALLIGGLVAGSALAQPAGSAGSGNGWGPNMMMGPGMMGPGGGRGMSWMCSPQAAGLAEWRKQRIEQLLKPTEAQRKALDDLQVASTKAAEAVSAACPREFPASAQARLELMEKRMEVMLTAIKTVRPAFDAFYATLSDEQKARLNSAGPRRWGWHGWRN